MIKYSKYDFKIIVKILFVNQIFIFVSIIKYSLKILVIIQHKFLLVRVYNYKNLNLIFFNIKNYNDV